MSLIDHYLPRHQFAEEHSRHIPASPARVLDVLGRPEVLDDPIARGLIALRETPDRLAGRLGFASRLQHRPSFSIANFTPLGRDGDREVAYGLAGRFWQSDYGLVGMRDAAAFEALDPAGIAKLVMNFTAAPEGAGTRLTTRTRVWCGDEAALRRFRLYWLLIRPASGLIRRRLLQRAHDAALQPLPS
ncbi:hypothetical protein Acav_1675 [Paracidovorax avenae ATCC 19860]|uniref:DUF2867 domain-containing protein n=1 Tax=Paracidovorax avenae (strain ATCC 19860 / DSM 7227 / CCUG 15838 / JCM 20985 / LMG 2117 / NCPPB 1011) TaxID=643561 RepID=F0Q5G5_PARA1|nr:hypothetical protein [Paracidovorax avenae]ADX45593.1 hypothetical protein Acav_1675 [Paracidovorax avenae ATCC 19860]